MRFVHFVQGTTKGLAVETDSGLRGLTENLPGYPGSLLTLLGRGQEALREAHQQLSQAPSSIPHASVTCPPSSGLARSSASA